ncbi:MAG: hypothetical protein WA705_09135 [Candidatus Ozemobacteraceae bacterium]
MIFRSLLLTILFCFFSWPQLWWYLKKGGIPGTLTWYALLTTFSAGPALAAWLYQRFRHKKNLREIGLSFIPNAWFLVAFILPAILGSCTVWLSSHFFDGTFDTSPQWLVQRLRELLPQELLAEASVRVLHYSDPSPLHAVLAGLGAALLAGVTCTGLVSLLEEVCWRGTVHVECRELGVLGGSFLTGLLFAIWQAPLAYAGNLLPGRPGLATALSSGIVILSAPLLFLLREASGSFVPIAIFQGTFYALGGLFLFVHGAPAWWGDRRGAAMILVLIAMNLVLYLGIKIRLLLTAHSPASSTPGVIETKKAGASPEIE